MRRQDQEVERVIDVKNSQSYVQYTDGRAGFLMTSLVPKEKLKEFYKEKKQEYTFGS